MADDWMVGCFFWLLACTGQTARPSPPDPEIRLQNPHMNFKRSVVSLTVHGQRDDARPNMSGTPAPFVPTIIAEVGLQVGMATSSVIYSNPIRSNNG